MENGVFERWVDHRQRHQLSVYFAEVGDDVVERPGVLDGDFEADTSCDRLPALNAVGELQAVSDAISEVRVECGAIGTGIGKAEEVGDGAIGDDTPLRTRLLGHRHLGRYLGHDSRGRQSARPLRVPDTRPECVGGLDVQLKGRFVEEDDRRLGGKDTRAPRGHAARARVPRPASKHSRRYQAT